MADTVYTIGHSTHSIERFVELLRQHSITAVCDVRSRPYSRTNPQFNREVLKEALENVSIKYVFLGKELGARTDDRTCYCNGKVQYELLAKTGLFKKGIDRVKNGAQEYRVALMCAEKEPLDCHRTILVARVLGETGMIVRHILANGTIEDHSHTLRRLVKMLRMPSSDMFRSEETVIGEAYTRQGQQIAYQLAEGAPPRYDVPEEAE
jgi:uncharacterized protein (DUF488 family)